MDHHELISNHGGGTTSAGTSGTSRVSFLYSPHTYNTSNTCTSSTVAPPPHSAGFSYGFRNYYQSLKTEGAGPSCPSQLKESTTGTGTGTQRGNGEGEIVSTGEIESIKAKIMSHPQYSSLLGAYLECQKVGAPQDVVDRLTTMASRVNLHSTQHRLESSSDPELDQFMEAYCNMLIKYKEELMRPIQEASEFLERVESQFSSLTNGASSLLFSSGVPSSEEEQDVSGGEGEAPEIDPQAEEKELKYQLLKKYSGYISNLRNEFSKKKKKGKLPKEARQKLVQWWELHYKWPYPSESEKIALAESTGLDQKQINNWFINQRKRHWKPSEDVQFFVMDGYQPQNAAGTLYLDGHRQFVGTDGFYRLSS